ncbi:2-isopropylmalate synthase [Cerasicoccus arenae]|uniref:2-isopropylmalate synthase n=1 Tax=Cerasicoccus arenae TaxID=424488 RepID=A0A8J3DF33_9BACT|nr:2-isopropylmalate synthase [Cerasicoccus arenae]MBK1859461.1 2-isopropylmalate synthase [Cerasicoccus arenae]GHC13692.1 2-isopropylmalate synthase [Cerasicoccus arenae]
MKPASLRKYRPFHEKFDIRLPDRQWPDRHIERAPIWCSVDLRDGNQALAIPMNVEEKLEYFQLLCDIGFKQIEIGFPSASDTEFRFFRRLVDEKLIPADVTVQCLVQAREHLIQRTFEALEGVPRSIVHLYNSTSPLQRKVTFGNASKEKIKAIAVDGAKLVRKLADQVTDGEILFQYSPESFSDTELDYAYDICKSVTEIWGPTKESPIILNLPATVEWATPNIHADMIEWCCRQLKKDGLRDKVQVSLHTHNDRGTGTAATELAILAGADRVEGTLFGNGERTGNLDLVNVALNLNSHGIATGLDFSNLDEIRMTYQRLTRMAVHERHPYAGELVFTAFSGSHQDAIKKGMDLIDSDSVEWAVPYLTIDPQDIGRNYEAIIRINSQSGKGGVAYVLDREHGLDLPKSMHPEVGGIVSRQADELGRELTIEEIRESFFNEFVNRNAPLSLLDHDECHVENANAEGILVHQRAKRGNEYGWTFSLSHAGEKSVVEGYGNGPINALAHALEKRGLKDFKVTDYRSHAITDGSAADAAAYVQIVREGDNRSVWGCGLDPSIELAGLKALVSAYNRLHH